MKTLAKPKVLLPFTPANAAAERAVEMERLREQRRRVDATIEAVPITDEHFDQRRKLYRQRTTLVEKIDALEMQGDGGPLVTVTLDPYSSAMVRRAHFGRESATKADVVAAALSFTLSEADSQTPDEEIEAATARRMASGEGQSGEGQRVYPLTPAGHTVTIRLSPVQMRMLMQVADDDGTRTMPEIVLRELGEHAAHMLECFHGHDLDKARQRWEQEGANL